MLGYDNLWVTVIPHKTLPCVLVSGTFTCMVQSGTTKICTNTQHQRHSGRMGPLLLTNKTTKTPNLKTWISLKVDEYD